MARLCPVSLLTKKNTYVHLNSTQIPGREHRLLKNKIIHGSRSILTREVRKTHNSLLMTWRYLYEFCRQKNRVLLSRGSMPRFSFSAGWFPLFRMLSSLLLIMRTISSKVGLSSLSGFQQLTINSYRNLGHPVGGESRVDSEIFSIT